MAMNKYSDQAVLAGGTGPEYDTIGLDEPKARNRHRRRRLALLLILIPLLSLLAFLAYILYRNSLLTRQAISNERLKYLSMELKTFKESKGSYPERLADLNLEEKFLEDGWGHAIFYTRIDEGYGIASFGKDGKSDGLDLALIRKPHLRARDCRNYDVDLIYTDLNRYRQCAK